MRRRDALKSIGGLVGAGAAAKLLSGCGDDVGRATANPTLVVVCMENRSYDHYLGARSLLEGKKGDGLVSGMSNPDTADVPREIFHDTVLCVPDPPHGWDLSHSQFNNGSNDGFMRAYQTARGEEVAPHVMGYLTRDDLPVSWALADAYTSCDRWFSSVMGPTWPNRMYLHSGQSGGLRTNDFPVPGAINWQSIHTRMSEGGVSWAYYYQDLPFVPLFEGVDIDGTILRTYWDFFDHAAAGTLPSVCFVEPAFASADDHPPHHPILGQQFLGAIYAALAASPQWNDCLLVITYDEAGGFFDHVPPPKAADDRAAEGFDQLGFRVPTLVAGPYVRAGHVSSTVRDHTSILAHIDRTFGLEPLTTRAREASDLSEVIDQDRLAQGAPLSPAVLPAVEVDEAAIEEACAKINRREKTDLERLFDAGLAPRTLDRRHTVRDNLYATGEVLDRFGAGRIRRRR